MSPTRPRRLAPRSRVDDLQSAAVAIIMRGRTVDRIQRSQGDLDRRTFIIGHRRHHDLADRLSEIKLFPPPFCSTLSPFLADVNMLSSSDVDGELRILQPARSRLCVCPFNGYACHSGERLTGHDPVIPPLAPSTPLPSASSSTRSSRPTCPNRGIFDCEVITKFGTMLDRARSKAQWVPVRDVRIRAQGLLGAFHRRYPFPCSPANSIKLSLARTPSAPSNTSR